MDDLAASLLKESFNRAIDQVIEDLKRLRGADVSLLLKAQDKQQQSRPTRRVAKKRHGRPSVQSRIIDVVQPLLEASSEPMTIAALHEAVLKAGVNAQRSQVSSALSRRVEGASFETGRGWSIRRASPQRELAEGAATSD